MTLKYFSEDCQDLTNKIPDSKYKTTAIRLKNGSEVACPPQLDSKNSSSWCATYVHSAKKGEPGHFDPKLDNIPDEDFDYDFDTPDDVDVGHAWGFCDKKCFETTENLKANVLQQVSLSVLTSAECRKMTRDNEDVSYRAKVDRELCAAKQTNITTTVYERKDTGEYKKVDKRVERHWGGSDSCQVRLSFLIHL